MQIHDHVHEECTDNIGVAVMIEANHSCINNRGINQKDAKMKTHTLMGCFRNDPEISRRFFQLVI